MAGERFAIAPYFDDLLARLEAGDETSRAAYGRHVHWGWWPDPATATDTAEDYGAAAERMCHLVCDAAGIADGMRVLDVGCGFGGTIASLNDRFHNLDLLGVNIDPRQVKRAQDTIHPNSGNRIRFEVGDACDLQVPAAAFDVVLAVECIFHFESRAAFLAGAAKALKPGGRLMVSDFVPTADALPLLERSNAGTDEATRTSYGKVDLLCTEERYRTLAEAVGFATRRRPRHHCGHAAHVCLHAEPAAAVDGQASRPRPRPREQPPRTRLRIRLAEVHRAHVHPAALNLPCGSGIISK